jgi:hypothetical protein
MNRIEMCFEVERQEDAHTVTVPACAEHGGRRAISARLWWTCPICGGPRGDIQRGFSFDGSQRLGVHTWLNPCGHVDYYSYVRQEAWANGLNVL